MRDCIDDRISNTTRTEKVQRVVRAIYPPNRIIPEEWTPAFAGVTAGGLNSARIRSRDISAHSNSYTFKFDSWQSLTLTAWTKTGPRFAATAVMVLMIFGFMICKQASSLSQPGTTVPPPLNEYARVTFAFAGAFVIVHVLV